MQGSLNRAAGVRHLDQETRQTIRDTEAYLQRMEAHTFHVPLQALGVAYALLSSDTGCGGAALVYGVMTILLALPALMLIGGIGALFSGDFSNALIGISIGAGLGYLWYRTLWVPRWKVNARTRDHRVRYQS
jgi:hypothetical protein